MATTSEPANVRSFPLDRALRWRAEDDPAFVDALLARLLAERATCEAVPDNVIHFPGT